MRILVTGATGLVGRELIRTLLTDQHEVIALSRKPAKYQRRLPKVQFHAWNHPTQEPPPPEALQDLDAVVLLAGEPIAQRRWSRKQKERIINSRVLTSRMILKGLQELEGKSPSVIVAASAIGFYGGRDETVLTESSEAGEGFLPEVCQKWEHEITTDAHENIRKVILRIGVVLSRRGGALKRMLPAFRAGIGGRLGDGEQWMSWIHVVDLVEMIRWGLFNDSVSGVLNAVAPQPVQNHQFTRSLAQALRRFAILPVPSLVLKLVLGEMAELVLGSQRVYPERAMGLGFRFRYPSIDEALGDLLRNRSPNPPETV